MHVMILVASTTKPQWIGILYKGQGSEIHCYHGGEADVEERNAYPARYPHFDTCYLDF
jgi:hypothetical protein